MYLVTYPLLGLSYSGGGISRFPTAALASSRRIWGFELTVVQLLAAFAQFFSQDSFEATMEVDRLVAFFLDLQFG